MKKKQSISLIILSFLFIVLLLTLGLTKKIQPYLSEALGQPAKIVVDVSVDQGTIIPIWGALAQGGEEKYPFDRIVFETASIGPKYIRLDHIYDYYDVVKKENGQLFFNWTQLDRVVDQIIQIGAIPFFSLSYMPPAIAQNGEVTNPPANWSDWIVVVRETIQHYSGRHQRNFKNVAYEIWNEPDLFGNWKIGYGKNYCQLYQYAIAGARETTNTNPFKIGGPATTAPYRAWVDEFLNFTKENNLRIDFYSWHRYSFSPNEFLKDVNQIDAWLFKNAGYSLEKYLTEWGSSAENSSYHDTNFDAAHLVAVTRQLLQRVDLAFVFEVKDGLSPEGKKRWGSWGLLTHESAGGVEKKPKYRALQMLNQMTGNRVSLAGEGTWVTGFAVKNGQQIKIILANFDPEIKHFERFPATIGNLENGHYFYQENYLQGINKESTEVVTNKMLKKEILLTPNNIVIIELSKAANLP